MTPSWQINHDSKEVHLDHIHFLQLACMGCKTGIGYTIFVNGEYMGYAVRSATIEHDSGLTEYPLVFYPKHPVDYISIQVKLV